MKILMLTQWFNPEPLPKGLAFAKKLIELGHDVEVLTGYPNYPGGKLYNGYKIKILQRENIEGVQILRVPLYPSHDKSFLRRSGNYFSFAIAAAIIGTIKVKPADILYVYHAPASIGFPAMVLRLFRNMPFVYDINDLWPDTLRATNMVKSESVLRIVDYWCNLIYKLSDHITVVTPGFKKALSKKGIPKEKLSLIYYWSQNEKMLFEKEDYSFAKKLGLDHRFNFMFAGTMGLAQDLGSVINAAKLIENSHPKIQFVFIGGGTDVGALKQRASALNLKNVLFLPKCPIDEIWKILSLADVLVAHLKDDPLFRITIPSKIPAYMAAGRPILVGVKGDASDLVMRANAGIECNPSDEKSIAEAVCKFYSMKQDELNRLGNNGKKFYYKELAMDIGIKRFEQIFENIIINKNCLKKNSIK